LKKASHSRRYFLKALGFALGSISLGFWGVLVKTQKRNTSKKIISLTLHDQMEVLFHEDCIIVNKEKLQVYSSYCSHLGCRIQTYDNGQLICPCHGSTFDLSGYPSKGPALEPLKKLEYELNTDTNTITINV
jgi:Rieske Fe-S protein